VEWKRYLFPVQQLAVSAVQGRDFSEASLGIVPPPTLHLENLWPTLFRSFCLFLWHNVFRVPPSPLPPFQRAPPPPPSFYSVGIFPEGRLGGVFFHRKSASFPPGFATPQASYAHSPPMQPAFNLLLPFPPPDGLFQLLYHNWFITLIYPPSRTRGKTPP